MRDKLLKIFCLPNLYLLLWLIYKSQSLFFGVSGTIYSQLVLVFVLLLSWVYFFRVIFKTSMPAFLRYYTLFFLFLSVYGIANILSPHQGAAVLSKPSLYLQTLWISMMPIYAFYYFSYKRLIGSKLLLFWGILFLVIAIVSYNTGLDKFSDESVYVQGDAVSNYGYSFLMLIPLICILNFQKKWITFGFLGIILFYILVTAKRGALLLGALLVLYYFYKTIKGSKQRRRVSNFLLIIIFVGLSIIMVRQQIDAGGYFSQRIDDTMAGDSSDRDVIYASIWTIFLNPDKLIHFLFGYGADGTLATFGGYAHNDWLEILINQGVFGALVYLIYFVNFFKASRLFPKRSSFRIVWGMCLLICVSRSFISMSYGDMSTALTLAMGYCLGMCEQNVNIVDC